MIQTLSRKYKKRRITEDDAVSKPVKYTLFFFNLFFWVVGGAVLGIGLYARLLQNDWDSVSGWSTDPAILMIVIGAVAFFVGFCGSVGALREHIILLKLFGFSLGIILALEIIAGILAFALKDKVKSKTQSKMIEAIEQYHIKNQQSDLDDAVEAVQIRFKCCGAEGPRDWPNYNRYYNCTKRLFDTGVLTSCGVPPACCKLNAKTDTQCGYKVFAYPNMTSAERAKWPRIDKRTTIIWTSGCADAVFNWIKDNYILLGALALGVLIVQIVGICLALNMIDQLNYIIKHFT